MRGPRTAHRAPRLSSDRSAVVTGVAAATAIGRRTVNVEPCPGPGSTR